MLTRPLGPLTVSALGLGAGHLDESDLTEPEAAALLDTALELGITFVDTARGYGASEARLGRILAARRDDVVLSTKVGYDVEGQQDWTPGAITGGVDRALRQLRTETIDVVFLHSCDLDVLRRGEVIEALLACREAGKIRLAGYSGENDELGWAVDSGHFDVVQTSVNLTDQRSAREVLPRAEARGTGVVAKRPIANAVWRHAERPTGQYGDLYWDRLTAMGLEPETDDWAATAIRFSAFTPGVSTAILGTSKAANLVSAAEAVARGPSRSRSGSAGRPPSRRTQANGPGTSETSPGHRPC